MDENKYEQYKLKDRQRKKEVRKNLTNNDLQILKLRTKVSMQNLR